MLVKALMTPAPEAVTPDSPAADVTALMRRRKVRHVPVVDAKGALVGIISDRDILRASHSPGRSHMADGETDPLDAWRARDLMTMVIQSTGPDRPAAEAGRKMLSAKLSCLPVIEHGAVVGILTESDFVKALSTFVEDE